MRSPAGPGAVPGLCETENLALTASRVAECDGAASITCTRLRYPAASRWHTGMLEFCARLRGHRVASNAGNGRGRVEFGRPIDSDPILP
jgi:hypothetical protein